MLFPLVQVRSHFVLDLDVVGVSRILVADFNTDKQVRPNNAGHEDNPGDLAGYETPQNCERQHESEYGHEGQVENF